MSSPLKQSCEYLSCHYILIENQGSLYLNYHNSVLLGYIITLRFVYIEMNSNVLASLFSGFIAKLISSLASFISMQ